MLLWQWQLRTAAIWTQAASWLGLALVARLLSIRLRVAGALPEVVGSGPGTGDQPAAACTRIGASSRSKNSSSPLRLR